MKLLISIDDVRQVADGGKPTLEQKKIKRIRPMGQTASQPSEQNWADRCRLKLLCQVESFILGKFLSLLSSYVSRNLKGILE